MIITRLGWNFLEGHNLNGLNDKWAYNDCAMILQILQTSFLVENVLLGFSTIKLQTSLLLWKGVQNIKGNREILTKWAKHDNALCKDGTLTLERWFREVILTEHACRQFFLVSTNENTVWQLDQFLPHSSAELVFHDIVYLHYLKTCHSGLQRSRYGSYIPFDDISLLGSSMPALRLYQRIPVRGKTAHHH
jgi:hypothetical protein